MWIACGEAIAAESGWIIEDRAAREAGVVLEVDGVELDATLPVELERDVGIVVQVDDDPRTGWVDAGLLYLVQGARGKVRATRPGVDVAADAIRVIADEEVARGLASDVDAELVRDGRGWVLRGENLLAELSHAAIPDADLDLELIPVGVAAPAASDSGPARPTRYATTRKHLGRPDRATRNAIALRRLEAPKIVASDHATPASAAIPMGGGNPPELVGWYCEPTSCVVLGIDGWAHRCTDARCVEVGRWWADGDALMVGDVRYVWRHGQIVREVAP